MSRLKVMRIVVYSGTFDEAKPKEGAGSLMKQGLIRTPLGHEIGRLEFIAVHASCINR